MVEHQDDHEVIELAIGIMHQHGAKALDHVVMLIRDAVRRGEDDAVLTLDHVMRYIERQQ